MNRFTLPRDLYHGENALEALKTFTGKRAVICVGGGSMKRFGFLDKAIAYLQEAGMEVKVIDGIERDPSVETVIKMNCPESGLFMVGGGTPKNFAQDTVVCAEILGKEVPMHKYAIQITVADVRDGACSSSTLLEAGSWGKVSEELQQMVYAEGTTVIPAIVNYAYHNAPWKDREYKNWQKLYK